MTRESSVIGCLLIISFSILSSRAGSSGNEAASAGHAARDQGESPVQDQTIMAEGETLSVPPPESWWPPTPPAAADRAKERNQMVSVQIASSSLFREPVRDQTVLDVMRIVPRHAFVPDDLQHAAYADSPLPIGHGQTISQPYIVAIMTELLEIEPGDKVLEIGTGSGYQAAVLAHLTPNVYTIEILEPLAERAASVFEEQGYKGIKTRHADGYFGWPEEGPFDAIIVTCSAGHLPPPLWEQLAPGGKIVIPIGGTHAVQRLVLMEKTEDGKRKSQTVMNVVFVPMTGEAQRP